MCFLNGGLRPVERTVSLLLGDLCHCGLFSVHSHIKRNTLYNRCYLCKVPVCWVTKFQSLIYFLFDLNWHGGLAVVTPLPIIRSAHLSKKPHTGPSDPVESGNWELNIHYTSRPDLPTHGILFSLLQQSRAAGTWTEYWRAKVPWTVFVSAKSQELAAGSATTLSSHVSYSYTHG